jgi:hypothetical protein
VTAPQSRPHRLLLSPRMMLRKGFSAWTGAPCCQVQYCRVNGRLCPPQIRYKICKILQRVSLASHTPLSARERGVASETSMHATRGSLQNLDSGLDHGLDRGLDHGLDWNMNSFLSDHMTLDLDSGLDHIINQGYGFPHTK